MNNNIVASREVKGRIFCENLQFSKLEYTYFDLNTEELMDLIVCGAWSHEISA